MSDFISKIQHKTYEKGEFSEEKIRTLGETIELIKTFPWDLERTLTSIELTGPSVTIRDEDINWLKVGLYFNGKFCLYYLDNNNHLYEYHAPNIDDAIDIVTAFFNQDLDLRKFEKHLFNVGNQAHFETKYFEYRVKFWWVILLTVLMLFYGFTALLVDISFLTKGVFTILSIGFIIFSLFLFYLLFRIFYHAFINRNNYLQISKGNDIFHFGYDENNINTYKKEDVKEVLVYDNRGGRNPNFVVVFEVYFKDETVLKFSNMLISDFAFESKFSKSLIKRGKKGLFKVL